MLRRHVNPFLVIYVLCEDEETVNVAAGIAKEVTDSIEIIENDDDDQGDGNGQFDDC